MAHQDLDALRAIVKELRETTERFANSEAYELARRAVTLLETCLSQIESDIGPEPEVAAPDPPSMD